MAFLLITATLYLTAPALYSTGLPTFSGLRQPPNPMMYITIPARLRLHACIRRRFCRQSSVVVFIPSELYSDVGP